MSPPPTISVCIPVFNGGLYIKECIESVLSQCYEHFEIIVCNNASCDNTLDVVSSIADSRIKIIDESQHVDMASNWQRTVGYANSDLLLILSADDYLLPGALRSLVTPFSGPNPPDIVVGRARNVVSGIKRSLTTDPKQSFSGMVWKLEPFVLKNPSLFNINAILFKRADVTFNADAGWVCDHDLLLNLGKRNKTALLIDSFVVAYRVHDQALSTNRIGMMRLGIKSLIRNSAASTCPDAYQYRIFRSLFWYSLFLSKDNSIADADDDIRKCLMMLNSTRRAVIFIAQHAGFLLPILLRARSFKKWISTILKH